MIFQLINEHMAVALNYGMFRRKELNNTAKHIMFYNMGASSSWATIVSTLTQEAMENFVFPDKCCVDQQTLQRL